MLEPGMEGTISPNFVPCSWEWSRCDRWTRHQLTYGTARDRRWVLEFFERLGTYYNGHLNEARIASLLPAKSEPVLRFLSTLGWLPLAD